jgi:hypothetical protein
MWPKGNPNIVQGNVKFIHLDMVDATICVTLHRYLHKKWLETSEYPFNHDYAWVSFDFFKKN